MFSLLVSETFQKLNTVMVAEGHIAAASLRVRLIADINLDMRKYYLLTFTFPWWIRAST